MTPRPGSRRQNLRDRASGVPGDERRRAPLSSQPLRDALFFSRARQTAVRRLWWVALLTVALVLVITSTGKIFLNNHTPEEAVESYLEGLKQGHYFTTLSSQAYRNSGLSYISSSAYSASEERITSFRILARGGGGAQTEVTALVKTGEGETRTVVFPVHRRDLPGPMNTSWEVQEPTYARLPVSANVRIPALSVNSQPVTLEAGAVERGGERASLRGSAEDPHTPFGRIKASWGSFPARHQEQGNGVVAHWTLAVLPGGYDIGVENLPYYSLRDHPEHSIAHLREARAPAVRLKLTPSSMMIQETEERIDSWLKSCLSSRSVAPAGCPASQTLTPGEALQEGVEEVEWTLQHRPPVSLQQDVAADASGRTWVTDQSEQATMQLSYQREGEHITETVSFPLSARVISDGRYASITVGLGEGEGFRVPLRAPAPQGQEGLKQ